MNVSVFYPDGKIITAESAADTVREMLLESGVYIDSPCGGRGKCGKCLVRLSSEGEEVLACQTPLRDGLSIYLPAAAAGMEIAGDTGIDKKPDDAGVTAYSRRLGAAVDIGTTTVVLHLHDLAAGARLATASGVNGQRVHGSDVVSRIEYSISHGHEELTLLIQRQLGSLLREALGEIHADSRDVTEIVIAGNTIMQHLAAGYSPAGMGTVPFEPVSLFGESLQPFEGLNLAENARIYYLPCPSSYVGGDITSGYISTGLESDDGPTVFIDIGTNGEISLKSGDRYYCCATAAGPAFEGAEIECGMPAISGAVSHIKWLGEENTFELSVIGDSAPAGFCGSGLLDALAMLLAAGAVDETGRMLPTGDIDHPISRFIHKQEKGCVFSLDDACSVYISSGDIRKLQLAKAAIAGGIATLLRHVGITPSDVKKFILAGGFGSFMNKESAAAIGLYPREFLPITVSAGNTAGEGASIVLTDPAKKAELDSIIKRCEYLELSSSPIFNEEFVEHMMFE